MTQIKLGDISADVVLKDIKNVHLSVYPPAGRVRISAPEHMSLDTIRVFAVSKLDWIKKQQKKLREQERETHREYVERESHYLWGKRYLLIIEERATAPSVEIRHDHLLLTVRPEADRKHREATVGKWYREQLRSAVPSLVAKWEPQLGVEVRRFYVQQMKTRWGSCNHQAQTIRLNTELAKKPKECLEYIVVHEMAHLLEPTHNERFVAILDDHMPNWRHHRQTLNELPVRHVEWRY